MPLSSKCIKAVLTVLHQHCHPEEAVWRGRPRVSLGLPRNGLQPNVHQMMRCPALTPWAAPPWGALLASHAPVHGPAKNECNAKAALAAAPAHLPAARQCSGKSWEPG